tara:strand:- start:20425 stop:20721 length:297 start_codon:yes stop_codon:yes gene_type:complete
MPIYKAKTKCFVGNSLRDVGEEFEYNGEFCKHLELISGSGSEPVLPKTATAEPVKETTIDYEAMTKRQLEEYGRTIGIELDRRQTKVSLIQKLEAINK